MPTNTSPFSKQKPTHRRDAQPSLEPVKRYFAPGDEWLYFKLYAGVANADEILTTAVREAVTSLKAQGAIDKQFFIRYNDPDFHLRLRFHLSTAQAQGQVLETLRQHLDFFQRYEPIWKTELGT